MEPGIRTIIGALLALSASGVVAHDAAPPARSITVGGEGEVSARPDRARLSLVAERLDPDLKKAEGEVNRIVRSYLAEAKALGLRDEQLSTAGVQVQPEYTWPEGGRERRFSGYRVSRQIELRIENLDRLADYILRATAVGVSHVHPPALESSRARELERQALQVAAEVARAKAQALSQSLNVRLGAAQRIHETGSVAPPIPYMAKAMRAEAADGAAEMGLSLGELRYRASVQVEFELLPP